jgi:hypothetical protein
VTLQERIVADTGTDVWRRARAVQAAARVPGAGREMVLRHVDDPAVVIAEAALGALAWSDRPDEALPVLLGHAGGDRARVALYAAGRAARHVRPALLPGLLGPVLAGARAKVTSRKEAARLLARYGPPGVMATLLTAYTDPAAHRDVRAAIASAARQRLGDAESWTILAAAVAAGREERLAVLAAAPDEVAARFRPRYAALIVTACRAADREVRDVAFARLPDWTRWADGAGALIEDRLADLDAEVDDQAAGRLAAALDEPGLVRTLDRLADREAADDRPGDPAADRPARRRLETIAQGAARWSVFAPAGADRSALFAAARRLATRPAHLRPALDLLVGAGRLENLDEVADLCAGRPVLAARMQREVGNGMYWSSLEPAVLRGIAAGLAARGDLAGGLLAVALAGKGHDEDWPPPWRDLLFGLRRHPEAEVRDEAYAVDMTG